MSESSYAAHVCLSRCFGVDVCACMCARLPASSGLPVTAPLTTGQPIIIVFVVSKSRWHILIQRWLYLSSSAATVSVCYPVYEWGESRCIGGWVVGVLYLLDPK